MQAELSDIQALVCTGFRTLHAASFHLLQIADRTEAKAWLRQAPILSAGERQDKALQVAFTSDGLRALGVSDEVMSGFSREFVAGMAADPSRSRRLGDVGDNDPQKWDWGWGQRVPHVVVMLYAKTDADLANWTGQIVTPAFQQAFAYIGDPLPTSDMGEHEPFGFKDGVSQPTIDWERTRTLGVGAQPLYTNRLAVGEFVLGYPNEYGLYTSRPLLTESEPGAELLQSSKDDLATRDLGRNGTYLVFRQLEQDVAGFWSFAKKHAPSDPKVVAAAMVGRTTEGEPLIQARQEIEDVDASARPTNNFTYDHDAAGIECPFGAHIRRANPRTADAPGGPRGYLGRRISDLGLRRHRFRDDLIASSRFHRILRRGREYGEYLSVEDALAGKTTNAKSGLMFICLNANIARQFEFIQNAWLGSAKFNGLSGESDPLLGNRLSFPPGQATDGFSVPSGAGLSCRLAGLPQFVFVRGGAYFFLPGLQAHQYLCR